jgi:signal peptidase II
MQRKALILNALAVGGGVVFVDQLMKVVVRRTMTECTGPPVSACERVAIAGPVSLLRLENAGSALGFLQGMLVWVFVAMLGMVLLMIYGRRILGAGWIAAIAIGLQAGGALSNLVDRVAFGSVTDFIDIGVGIAFNPADMALLTGMLLAFQAAQRQPLGEARGPRRPAFGELTLAGD